MKNRVLTLMLCLLAAFVMVSCDQEPFYDLDGDDKNKIDIKGSLTNGDMKSSLIRAGYYGKTLHLFFYDEFGDCSVTVSDKYDRIIINEVVPTYYGVHLNYYMGDQPLGRYHLVISNGTDDAEGWFNTFRIVTLEKRGER